LNYRVNIQHHKNTPDLNLLTDLQGPRHKVFLPAHNFQLTRTDIIEEDVVLLSYKGKIASKSLGRLIKAGRYYDVGKGKRQFVMRDFHT